MTYKKVHKVADYNFVNFRQNHSYIPGLEFLVISPASDFSLSDVIWMVYWPLPSIKELVGWQRKAA